MRDYVLRLVLHRTLAATAGICLLIGSGFADVLTLTDGTVQRGRFLGYDSGAFLFQIGEAVYPVSATKVSSVAIEATQTDALIQSVNQMAENLALVMQQMEQVQARLDALSAQQQTQTDTLHQRLFELNPLSRLRVENDSGVFARDGSFHVTGQLRNMANTTVRWPKVRIDLLDANGIVVTSQTITVDSQAIGPGGYSAFRYTFPSPPVFTQYRITPVMEYTTPPVEEGQNPYPPIRMENR